MSLKDDILDYEDLPLEKVDVPEWGALGDQLYIRNMTGTERDEYEAALIENRDKPTKERLRNVRAQLVAMVTVSEDGSRIFSDEDVEAVGLKSANALDKIVMAARKLNKLDEDDVEEAAKNSEASGDEDSISE